MLNKDKFGIAFFILSLIGILIVTITTFTQMSIWYDEVFSLMLVDFPLSKMITWGCNDVHPLLYYFILRFFKKIFFLFSITDMVFIGRVVSLIPFYILILFSYKEIRKDFDLFTAGLFAFLIVCMPQLMFFAVEVRMYGWAMLFLTLSFVYMYKIISNSNLKYWAFLTIFSIAAAYTHYFAAVGAMGLYLIFLIYMIFNNKKLIKYWLFSTAICILSYIPWIPVLLNQIKAVHAGFWVEPISFHSIVTFIYYVFAPFDSVVAYKVYVEPSILGTLMVIGVLAVIIYCFTKRKSFKNDFNFSIMGLAIFLFVPILGFVISIIYSPIFFLRYICPVLGILWLSFAILFREIFNNKKIFYPILILLLVIGAVGTYDFVNAELKDHNISMQNAEMFKNVTGENNIVIVNRYDTYYKLVFFYNPNNDYHLIESNSLENTKSLLNNSDIQEKIKNGSKVYYIDIDYAQLDEFNHSDIKIKKIDGNPHLLIREINVDMYAYIFEIDTNDYKS